MDKLGGTMKIIDREEITKRNYNQREVILLHLIENGYITNKDCNEAYGFRHLPSIIRDLKKLYGCQFDCPIQKQFNRFGQKTEFTEYHLKNREVYKCLLSQT